jgi:hypothetical protein
LNWISRNKNTLQFVTSTIITNETEMKKGLILYVRPDVFMGLTSKTAVCWVVATCDLGSAELCYLATKLSNIITHETGILK